MMATLEIGFTRGVPPAEIIPAGILAEIAAQIVAERPSAMFQYAPLGGYRGDPELRSSLATAHAADPDEVFVGNGSLQVLDLVAQLVAADGRRVAFVEAPTYDRARQVFARRGLMVCGITLQPDGLDVEQLDSALQSAPRAVVYLIPDFQNPTGVTMSAAKREAVASLAVRHDCILIDDSPYRHLRLRGADLPRLAEVGDPSRTISIGSLSKSLSPGLRVGFAICGRDRTAALARLAEATYLSPAPLTQAIAARAIHIGALEQAIARARVFLRVRHDAAVRAVADALGSERLICQPNGGYFLGLFLDGTDEQSLHVAARAAGLRLTSGSGFGPPPGRTFVRLPFQALPPAEFRIGVERLATVLEGASLHEKLVHANARKEVI